jgi:hypothetical protein
LTYAVPQDKFHTEQLERPNAVIPLRNIAMRFAVTVVLLLTACSLAVGNSPRCAAGEILATEVMMESQGLQAIFIGQILRPDSSSTLSFTSQVDSQGQSFQYSIASGSTYLGMPVTWQTTGTFDSTTSVWSWTTTSTIGSLDLSSSGGGGPFSGPDPDGFHLNIEINLPSPGPKTTISNVTYTQTAARTVSEGTITVMDATGKVTSSGIHTDQLILQGPNAGMWMWDTNLITGALGQGDFVVGAAGFSPQPNGGAGTFTLGINAVPEPSAFALLGIAAAVGLSVAVSRQVGRPIRVSRSASALAGDPVHRN